MDRELDALGMLDLMVSPGFCVKKQKIVKCNAGALGLLLREGMDILPLLATGQHEYAEFSGGCLYLMLDISGIRVGASVSRIADGDIFLLDEESEQAELYSPDRISSVAEGKLGMTERVSGNYLYLSDDVVATDSKGDISITGTFSAYVVGDSDDEMDLLSGD